MPRILIIHIVVVLLLHGSRAFSQGNQALIETGYHEVGIRSDGMFFEGTNGAPLYKINGKSEQQMFGFSGMWLVAKKSDQTKVGFVSRENSKSELASGPIDTLLNKAVDNPTDWDHVWSVNQTDIKSHRSSWDQNGYTPTWSIANWPARHNQNYVPEVMAPFVDWNSDLRYNPMDGDYPYFKGENLMYFIANDEGKEHSTSGLPSMLVEVQGQVFTVKNSAMEQVVFSRIFIINRSDQDYDSLFFGQYNHFVLGNINDNYIGTDVALNSVFAYNGDNNDEGGFEKDLPFAACIFLNQNITASVGFMGNDSVRKFPVSKAGVWNTMQGKWRDGSSIRYEQNGNGSSGNIGRFVYPGTTDPDNAFTNWTNSASTDGPGKRNILGVTGPYNLKNNSVIMLDMAYVTGTVKDSVTPDQIADKIKGVKEYYNQTLSSPKAPQKSGSFKLYPNPVPKGQNPIFECQTASNMRVYNITGRLVYEAHFEAGSHPIEMKRILGVYLVEIETQQNKRHFRLVLE